MLAETETNVDKLERQLFGNTHIVLNHGAQFLQGVARVLIGIPNSNNKRSPGHAAIGHPLSASKQDGSNQGIGSGIKSASVMKPHINNDDIREGSDKSGASGSKGLSIASSSACIGTLDVEDEGILRGVVGRWDVGKQDAACGGLSDDAAAGDGKIGGKEGVCQGAFAGGLWTGDGDDEEGGGCRPVGEPVLGVGQLAVGGENFHRRAGHDERGGRWRGRRLRK